jgi:hypothetical protein
MLTLKNLNVFPQFPPTIKCIAKESDETPSHPLSTYQYLTRNEREVMEVPDKIRATLPPSKYITSYENVKVYFQQYISDILAIHFIVGGNWGNTLRFFKVSISVRKCLPS